MTSYNAVGEINISPTQKRAQTWMDHLGEFHPAIAKSPRNGSEVIISFEAETLEQATRVANVLLRDALGQVDRLTVMTTEEYDRRVDDVDIPTLVGATEAAEILGVTRQRVQQLAATGTLPHAFIGRALAFPRATVEAMAQTGVQPN